jgi:EmrB/QacA subfamily drug resistance transporter
VVTVQYKWIVLSNTTLGVLMASIDINIVLIALPAIFRGINIDPLTSFQYLLWILFGYSIVTATLLVTFGRISDMFGRVRLYNLGFAIYTVGSILLYFTPNTGDAGALELIIFRIVQGIGGAFLFSNSAAIITDAFPPDERGKALGINQVAALVGGFLGLILGGVLAVYDWRWVFLISVPFGLFGTVWSYWKLKELAVIRKGQNIDVWGNVTFGVGLTVFLIAITYGLLPYGNSAMGWGSPYVMAGLLISIGMLAAFPFIEMHVRDPMFKLELFRRRAFAAGNFASFLASISRGGVMLMLVILLQAIWLPLHGVPYEDTPLWAGIYMVPMTVGFLLMGSLSGWLSDKYGARGFSTLGMIVSAFVFLALTYFPYNFDYVPFAVAIFVMGLAMGMFASPNTASIMNSVPPEDRGSAAGMRSTLQNTGSIVGLSILFTVVIAVLSADLPHSIGSALTSAGASQLAPAFDQIPPTAALFAAFLGYNPMQTFLSQLPHSMTASLSTQTISVLTGMTWFPLAIAPAFMASLNVAFYFNVALAVVAAAASALRGHKYIYGVTREEETAPVKVAPFIGTPSRQVKNDPTPSSSSRLSERLVWRQTLKCLMLVVIARVTEMRRGLSSKRGDSQRLKQTAIRSKPGRFLSDASAGWRRLVQRFLKHAIAN